MTERAARMYAKRRKARLCVRCGKKSETGKSMCAKHADQFRAYQRKRYAQMMEAWKPGQG